MSDPATNTVAKLIVMLLINQANSRSHNQNNNKFPEIKMEAAAISRGLTVKVKNNHMDGL